MKSSYVTSHPELKIWHDILDTVSIPCSNITYMCVISLKMSRPLNATITICSQYKMQKATDIFPQKDKCHKKFTMQ